MFTQQQLEKVGIGVVRVCMNPASPKLHLLAEKLGLHEQRLNEEQMPTNLASVIFSKWLVIQNELLKLQRGGQIDWNRLTTAVRDVLRPYLAWATTR